ncbi:MAG: hypothetical protein KVP17_005097 [Porospora cf. gigantea B]|uniref:uncharacterized protein n=1 Tax=Porospora cf. gigantea B TaxID=2853592 RepID=UPI003571B60C|nr:MAG: hypothetical protein KVP17_005097 [Porospora cf. gigantea B]
MIPAAHLQNTINQTWSVRSESISGGVLGNGNDHPYETARMGMVDVIVAEAPDGVLVARGEKAETTEVTNEVPLLDVIGVLASRDEKAETTEVTNEVPLRDTTRGSAATSEIVTTLVDGKVAMNDPT